MSHKYISSFIRRWFTAPAYACGIDFRWLDGLWKAWLANVATEHSGHIAGRWSLIVKVTHLQAQLAGVRPDTLRKPRMDTINFRSISPHRQWPLTVHSSQLRGLWLLRKAQQDSLPHLCFPPAILSSALLHMSASSDTYVAFRVCQSDCFSFTCRPWMNAPLYLFIVFCCSLLLFYPSIPLSS